METRILKPAVRTENIQYAIRDIVLCAEQAQAAGRELLYLNIGDPLLFDYATPPHIIDAIYKAQRDGFNGYAPSSGVPSALDAIRQDGETRGIKNIRNIFVSSGVSEAIEIAFSALLNDGDNVLVPQPVYPLYTSVLSKYESSPNYYLLDEENDWQPDLEDIKLKINERTKAIVLINPNNPTGGVYSKETLLDIAELAREYNLMIFSDEIYDKIIIDQKEYISIASLCPDLPVMTLNGLSKGYLVPGLRIGWAVTSGPENVLKDYIEAMLKMTRVRLCANHPCQHAIAPALQGDQSHLATMAQKLKKRRDLCYQMLNDIPGISMQKPEGAFYAFPKLEDIQGTDEEFVKKLIMETGVMAVHGSGFGQKKGTNHMRIVFLAQEEILKKACNLIREFKASYPTA